MSDAPQGPGWWQASDGRWYPPQAPPGAPGPATTADDVLPAGAPPSYGGPAYGSPGAYPPAPVQTAGKATATLVLAIVSFVVCPILPAIAALIVGAKAAREIRESGGRLGGEGLVKAGRILAIVHLGLSVVMIPLMAAIAIPTFLGAQERAQDRSVQSDLLNAFTAEQVYRTDTGVWTDDPVELQAIEPSLRFAPAAVPQDDVVAVQVRDDVLLLSAKSESGTCFYLAGDPTDGSVGYAEDEGCGAAETQQFVNEWE